MARAEGMDLLGCNIVGSSTALGGGSLVEKLHFCLSHLLHFSSVGKVFEEC